MQFLDSVFDLVQQATTWLKDACNKVVDFVFGVDETIAADTEETDHPLVKFAKACLGAASVGAALAVTFVWTPAFVAGTIGATPVLVALMVGISAFLFLIPSIISMVKSVGGGATSNIHAFINLLMLIPISLISMNLPVIATIVTGVATASSLPLLVALAIAIPPIIQALMCWSYEVPLFVVSKLK